MPKSRTYEKTQNSIECRVYMGNKMVLHLVYYPGHNYGYPRYHFENFFLQLPDLDYEIVRFMKFVHKVLSNPQLDVDNVGDSLDSDLSLF